MLYCVFLPVQLSSTTSKEQRERSESGANVQELSKVSSP